MNPTTILICDDNETVHETLQLYLQAAGYQVLSVYDGEAALEAVRQNQIDLMILDILMPKMFGTEVCRQVRNFSNIPIIILSAKGDECDRISGLELGADDYITKPFSSAEVVSRVKAILRRCLPKNEATVLQVGHLKVDLKRYEVFVGNDLISLTPKEVELLAFLMRHVGEILSREVILNAVWGYEYYGNVRTVDTMIARIRRNIREHEAHVRFRSIYGVGYMIEECHA